MNSSNVSDALLATLLASGKLGGLGQGNEEGSGSTLLEKVLQLSGQFQGGANPQLLRLQNLAANSVAAPVTPTPVMNSGAAYGLSQSELLQALQSDQNQAQLVMIADKLRQQSQGASSNFTNRVPTMDKLLSRDQDAVNLSLGLTNDLQNGSFFSSQMGSLADTNMFRNTALAANGGRGLSQDMKDLAFNKVRIMGVDINQNLGLTSPQKRPEDALQLELLKRKEEFSLGKDADNDINSDDINSRKKMRLTRQQSMYLEQKFYNQESLTASQKSQVAKELGLLPRQVEVWFQNRRARRRLKQAELDCEMLRKSCKALQEENLRLAAELKNLQRLGESDAPSQDTTANAETQLGFSLVPIKEDEPESS